MNGKMQKRWLISLLSSVLVGLNLPSPSFAQTSTAQLDETDSQLLSVPLKTTSSTFVPEQQRHYRIQLKHNGEFLDANYCTDNIKLAGISYYEGGACQLWSFIPAGGGYYRIQLQQSAKYLDANYCTDNIMQAESSSYKDGACQLWRIIPSNSNGYYRLQLKDSQEYLDANYCTDNIMQGRLSDYDNGGCQLWRFIVVN